jgi:hypothetical protein
VRYVSEDLHKRDIMRECSVRSYMSTQNDYNNIVFV